MTGEAEKMHRNGSILVVALKLDRSSRELLTWTLAKFTQAGDRVIAIHVPAPSSRAGIMRTKSEIHIQQEESSLGDSLIAGYESFCSIKQVDLQLKVARGASLRESLVEECKRSNASKLILGHAPPCKLHTGHSFSLAKYCSRQLPSTCSVIVIEHGQITFEKEGFLRSSSIGDNRSGVLEAIQRTLRNRSWKNSGHQLSEGRKTSMPSESLELEMRPDEYASAPCAWPLPSRFLESPVSVLHSYKHSSFHKKGVGAQDSPLSVSGSLGEQDRTQNQAVANLTRNGKVESDQKEVAHSRHSLEECFALAEQNYGNDLYSNYASAKVTLPHSVMVISPKSAARKDGISYTIHGSLDAPIEDINSRENAADEGGNRPNIGWPLLRKHFTIKQQNYKLAGPLRLSVVEWAMQLPDRPRESVNTEAEFMSIDCQTICSQVCSEILDRDQPKTEENPSVCEVDDIAQPKTDALRSRLAKLSAVRTCKEFQLKELQTATSNFDSG